MRGTGVCLLGRQQQARHILASLYFSEYCRKRCFFSRYVSQSFSDELCARVYFDLNVHQELENLYLIFLEFINSLAELN